MRLQDDDRPWYLQMNDVMNICYRKTSSFVVKKHQVKMLLKVRQPSKKILPWYVVVVGLRLKSTARLEFVLLHFV